MLSWLYGKIINKRNSFYENGTFKTHSLNIPTISVGNITVGGTGKTPIVSFIAELLAEKGEKVCIISRGYKRENEKERILVSDGKKILSDAKKSGDEPFELANKLLGKALVIADANRIGAGIWARDKFGITSFILDDAFQHRKIQRDLDIVAIDATNPFGNQKTLPTGILREPLENLHRADLIILTRSNLASNLEDIKSKIGKWNKKAPIFTAQNKTLSLINLKDFNTSQAKKTDNQLRKNNRYLAFCGLGNPNNFFNQLKNEDFNIIKTQAFPDHYSYTQKDIENIENIALKNNVTALLTTAKDGVKFKDLNFNLPCYIVESELFFDDKKKLREIIHAVFNK